MKRHITTLENVDAVALTEMATAYHAKMSAKDVEQKDNFSKFTAMKF